MDKLVQVKVGAWDCRKVLTTAATDIVMLLKASETQFTISSQSLRENPRSVFGRMLAAPDIFLPLGGNVRELNMACGTQIVVFEKMKRCCIHCIEGLGDRRAMMITQRGWCCVVPWRHQWQT